MTEKEEIYHENIQESKGEKSPKAIDFFAYKRNMTWLMEQFRENGGFVDKDQMKEFIYNEQQDSSDGIIMEVNTSNVGGPGIIEHIDGADIAYMKTCSNTSYSRIIRELNEISKHENGKRYFEKYILAELKNKSAERIVLLFPESKDYGPLCAEDIGLEKEYADYVSLETVQKMIKDSKVQLEKTLLMNYGFVQSHKPEKNHEQFQKIFQDRYINQENIRFSSKQRPTLLGRKALTGPYMTHEDIRKIYGMDIMNNRIGSQHIEKSYMCKVMGIDQGKGIAFPGERNFIDGNSIKLKNKDNQTIKYYALQKFHELPRKITLEEGGMIGAKTVDIRAYATFNAETFNLDIQIFGREGNIGTVNNVTSGGKFTKIYTVADDAYYGMQSKIHTLVRELGNTQNNAIEKYFDEYAMKHFKITPDAKISYIPFLLSESGFQRLIEIVRSLFMNMFQSGYISQNEDNHIIGNPVLGIDLSINPLPKAKQTINLDDGIYL